VNNETFLRQIKNQKNHWWFQGRKNIINKIIFRINFKKKINILDFGSGSGVNVEMLTKYGRVDLQEKNKIARLNLKKKKNFNKIYSSLKIKKNYYNLILVADVLEHVKKPKELLRILKKNIKKNGYILITVPAYQFLFSTKDKALEHYRRYNKKTLKKTIDEFALVKMSYFNSLLFIPIIAIILFNKIFNINYIKKVEKTPNFIINKILFHIFSFENIFLKYLNFPFGLSIYALIKK
jgi:2-polyprenyl-3-methyl-5-hydroxy-6-metoxy-1,4-benzoquinol methylase